MIRKQDDLVGSMFHDIAHLIRHKIDDMLRPYGLTRLKWLALGIILDNEGLTQVELARRLELKTAATGKLVDRLEQRGLVERRRDPDDRRAHRLVATGKSVELLGRLGPLSEAVRNRVLDGLDEEELRALGAMLERIKANLTTSLAGWVAPCLVSCGLLGPVI